MAEPVARPHFGAVPASTIQRIPAGAALHVYDDDVRGSNKVASLTDAAAHERFENYF